MLLVFGATGDWWNDESLTIFTWVVEDCVGLGEGRSRLLKCVFKKRGREKYWSDC